MALRLPLALRGVVGDVSQAILNALPGKSSPAVQGQ